MPVSYVTVLPENDIGNACIGELHKFGVDYLKGERTEEGIPAKVQLGSGWWFNDTKDGMVNQMTSLANIGLLSKFIGMLTDSRTFISYTRHEYFRRILCNLLGQWAENGEAPSDMDLLGRMVQDICFYNAKNYFRF